MSFKYSCFISYSASGIVPDTIEYLKKALEDEIGSLMRDEEVYLDRDRLKGGDFFNESLSNNLCKSVCMILVYTRPYFDINHSYCAREFRAMEKLEEKRLQMLGKPADIEHGLIIPIILRGSKYLPSFIKDKRHCYNFENYRKSKYKNDNIFCTQKKYSSDIRMIAEYICDRYIELNKVCDTSKECRDFKVPAQEEVHAWLDGINNESNGIESPFPCGGEVNDA